MATSGIPEWARREYCHRQTDRDAGAAARDVRPTNYLAAAAVHMRALNAEAHAGGRLAAAAAAKTSTWKAAKVEPAVRAQWWAHRFLSQVKSRLCTRSTARGECAHCGATFRSRSQLFEHLRA